MTNEQIEKVMDAHLDKSTITIYFKTRSTIKGIFIKTPDYTELKEYQTTKDTGLARIFNGTEFTRLNVAS